MIPFGYFINKWMEEGGIRNAQVETYLKHVDTVTAMGEVREQPFYTNYISNIEAMKYRIPEVPDISVIDEVEDWDLLLQLIAGSFSSRFSFSFSGESAFPELKVTVESRQQCVTRTISSLWSFHVERLFETYLHEQMTHTGLWYECANEKRGIESFRKKRLKTYGIAMEVFREKLEVFSRIDPKVEPASRSDQLSPEKALRRWLEEMKCN